MRRALLALASVSAMSWTGTGVAAAPAPHRVPSGVPPHTTAWLLKPTALRASPGGRVIARLSRRTEFGSRRILGVVGHRGRWLRVSATQIRNGGTGWIDSRAVLEYANDWRVDAFVSRREVVVRHAGRVVQRFPVAVGRAGHPTPPGRYAVTDRIHFRQPGAYGCCALALTGHQPRTPQGWGGGDRLAIHGTPHEWSIGTAASLGCLRARRRDVYRLVMSVPLGTMVRIRG
jgi:hypothetical protein